MEMSSKPKSREDRFVDVESKIVLGRRDGTLDSKTEERLLTKSDDLWADLSIEERARANKRCAKLFLPE